MACWISRDLEDTFDRYEEEKKKIREDVAVIDKKLKKKLKFMEKTVRETIKKHQETISKKIIALFLANVFQQLVG